MSHNLNRRNQAGQTQTEALVDSVAMRLELRGSSSWEGLLVELADLDGVLAVHALPEYPDDAAD